MELRDFIVTPVVILVVYAGAYFIRPFVTDTVNYKYFLPALTVRIVGALLVGFIYQFYYGGGDTFAYHTFGSRILWEAFWDSPLTGVKLFFADGQYEPSIYLYASKIWYFRDQQSYFLICIAALFDLLTFSTYTATAVLFAVFGFSGSWMLFKVFYRLFPDFHRWIAFACLFVPTVCFWGSGIFKDTVTLSALGWITYSFYEIFFNQRRLILNALILMVGFWMIYTLKKYILLSYLPAIIQWFFFSRLQNIKSVARRILVVPLAVGLAAVLGYLAVVKVGEDDARYSVDQLSITAKMTAYDIRYGWGARTGEGSGYTLGELDGTWTSMIRLAPQAINVSLFRPYLWEVGNPLMLISGLESFLFFVMTIYLLFKTRSKFFSYVKKPEIIFCLTFSLIFAFAVGISTYNFGTLSRYKIPMEPFYLLGIGLIYHYSNRDKKLSTLEANE